MENIGNVGSDLTSDELFSRVYKDQCIYGSAWVENIFNTRQNKIVDLDIIDAKKMDYFKNSSGNIVLDKYSRPVGYTQDLPFNMFSQPKGDAVPNGFQQPSDKIFLNPERIAHFKRFTFGDGFYPVGIIEPAYNAALWKLNIEKGLSNFIYMSGFPTRVVYVGDQNHEPTPAQITNILDKLKEISYKQNIAVPYYHKIELLESKNAEKMQQHLDYFREQEVTSMGIPKPFATGGGEETNRSTLNNQDRMFRLTLKEMMENTNSVFKKQIFSRIAKYEGFKVTPDLVWGEIEESAELDKIKLIIEAIKAGAMTPEDAKDHLKNLL